MAIKNNITLALVTAALVTSQTLLADAQDRRQAKRIHDRLTGVNPTTATIDAMEATLDCQVAKSIPWRKCMTQCRSPWIDRWSSKRERSTETNGRHLVKRNFW